MIFIVLIIILLLILYIFTLYSNNKNSTSVTYSFSGEKCKYILTKNELSFFYKLKSITDKYELYIFPKIRLADLINTNNITDFNKIKSKHIDFTICDKYCRPIILIELDDNSHHMFITKEKDIKKDYILESVNADFERVKINEIEYKLQYIESILISKLNI